MYKYDRALRQQALRQRELLLSQGFRQQRSDLDFASNPADTPPDIKPDVSQLCAASRTPQETVRSPTDDVSPSRYRRAGDLDRLEDVTSAPVGSSPSWFAQEPYPPRQQYHHHQQRYSSLYDYDTSVGGVAADQNPLDGLSHMTIDVANFVGQARNFPAAAAGQSRAFAAPQPPRPPAPPYLSSGEFRAQSSALRGGWSFRPVFPKSAFPFPPPVSSPPTGCPETPRLGCLPVSSPSAVPTSPMSSRSSANPVQLSPLLSDFIGELRRNEPNQRDVQKKLANLLLAAVEEQRQRPASAESPPLGGPEPGGDDATSSQLRRTMEVVSKMCDQMLFMMVEWARGARFFHELKVNFEILTSSLTGAA